MTGPFQARYVIMVVVAATLTVFALYILNTPDHRNAGEKLVDTVNELPNGIDKAARQTQDRTPGDKLKDAAKDATSDVKKSINQQ